MSEVFHDPIAPRSIKPKPTPKEGKNSPWDFRSPKYDERSSCYVNAGTNYGVGFNQPIGHQGNPKAKLPSVKKHFVEKVEDRNEIN